QQIFYGAPGTGKSHEIKKTTDLQPKENVFRTTFHPDSDYSTFVGCYKPTMQPTSKEEKTLTGKDEEITYKFVPQAFLKAYVRAYQTTDPVYLVIEEINRGNCAQIFGDLFQLLDREDGVSEYPIKADDDLAKYLRDTYGEDFAGIANGELCLPSNLYIWATMNTSDQSLFPIDSAFKRRWEWQYMPIEDAGKNWKIRVNNNEYDWYAFLTAINHEILALTHSEDKQLGYFFAKADAQGVIDAAKLVNKVYFYLWTDVFKDYETENNSVFKKADSNDTIAYKDFFATGQKINEEVAEQLLKNLKLNTPEAE
ncbi:MAG: AAA family ATPase, partial [Bacteroidaceae bacterium]|nr:AAA family ATPase [Bacteroidaceae bacterium]